MSADDWFPVGRRQEPMPDDGELVLVLTHDERDRPFVIQAYYWHTVRQFYLQYPSFTKRPLLNVTHWQYIEYPREE